MTSVDYRLENEDLDLDEGSALNPQSIRSELEDIYPEANIKVEREQYSIFELNRKFNRGQVVLDPDFQREDVWKNRQKSELVESVLMGIPLPIFYLNETKEGKLVVVDGRQRLTAFFQYLNEDYKLTDLRILKTLNNKYFSDLDKKLQANLEDFQLIAQVIKPPTPDRIKFDIFDRVNRGGTPLNNQEMRNALYQGKSTKLLASLSVEDVFLEVTSNSINSKRMKDRYLILRFIGFYLLKENILKNVNGDIIDYKGDIDEFLGKIMDYINDMSDEEVANLRSNFIRTMKNNQIVFGDNAFRRVSKKGKKQPINMLLFEAFSYLFTKFDEEYCVINHERIYETCVELLKEEHLNKLLTNDRGRGIVVPELLKIMDNLKENILA
ncbi:DUF262 domain-containing protein [Mesobacillus sp. AQ2]|uniref:DUF262 domain-containing protein n=1 Tax=Mesobacillus sp. AQ2 TaxID=3043332 RepID=UPI0024C1B931|nr:DUF262 domain-containing protein [Mesobacillus sp. AQ2]WHX41171.1 DUF262 domain-containing protein [Mesobacillus sp. AQ2]